MPVTEVEMAFKNDNSFGVLGIKEGDFTLWFDAQHPTKLLIVEISFKFDAAPSDAVLHAGDALMMKIRDSSADKLSPVTAKTPFVYGLVSSTQSQD